MTGNEHNSPKANNPSDDNMFGPDETEISKVDQVAQSHGFRSREKRTRRNETGPTRQLSIRVTEDTFNRLEKYASDNHGLTYRHLLEKLLTTAGY